MTFLFLVLGFALLVGGGELLVRGAVALSERLGVSPLLIGLTVVGFGTSTPELVTSLQAAAAGAPGIAVGNVVGSNTANILLILGIAALISPVAVTRAAFLRDGGVAALAALAALAVVLSGTLSRPAGAALVLGLVAYIVFAWSRERRGATPEIAEAPATGGPGPLLAMVFALGGIGLTILGARLLVTSAIEIATAWGVSEAVIGVTIVAVGTSLPELVTAVVAARRGQGDIAFGNVVGSNIYNVFGILGVTALAAPIPVPAEIVRLDIWVMLAGTAALVAVAATGWRITRGEGGALLAGYTAYLGWLAYTI
ncbi:calcium/sodium antiporter [Palleronia sediminis]|uniref:Calcium/sodium antiporter n=1 Tax=Palleronia sediminis TaxID=2547833 RepID=A0A4R6A7D7_9RHOB|nr:calcium/sodium antiporter [Palleronia sediminis]TDL79580.1 calcium/sodium antiporter [Palleronia sediminis]